MELKEYIKILKKEKLSISSIVGFAIIIGIFYSLKSTPGYKIEQIFLIEATISALPAAVSVSPQISAISPQEEARNFTETAVALIKSNDLAQNQFQTALSAEKVAPQLIKVTVTAKSKYDAKIQIEKTVASFNRNIKELIKGDSVTLKPIGATPEASLSKIDSKIILALSFFAGLTFALLTVSLKTYFRL